MRHPSHRSGRRLADPRGTVLMICLMLMIVVTLLGGLLLLLARSEGSISGAARASIQAMTAAEYGIELAFNGLNPTQPGAPFPTQTLGPGISAVAGLRDGSNATPVNQGAAACPAGYSVSLGCQNYTVAATGWARTWLVTSASTQLEQAASVFQGCAGTEYSC